MSLSTLSEENKQKVKDEFPNMVAQNCDEYNRLLNWYINLDEYLNDIKEIEGGRIIMACGATGCGKSTLMNSFISGVDEIDFDDDYNFITNKPL